MIAILFSWIVISFISFSWGNLFISIYNKIGDRKAHYNYLDCTILGLVAISIPLSIWSLWLPSNYIFLLLSLIIGIISIITNKQKWEKSFNTIKYRIKRLPHNIIFSILFFSLMILISCTWIEGIGDSLYYHHQNIRWNEEYAVVPGLGNLDDKFAFNSQYLLISSIFTFRPLFNQALYPIIPLFVIFVIAWLLIELHKSDYELKRVIVLIAYIIFIFISLNSIFDTSTDLLPNILAFYISAQIIFYPHILSEKRLLYFSTPLFLIMCKIAMLPFCIFSLYVLIMFVRKRTYLLLSYCCLLGLFLCIPWLIRNVILSGYLVYPVYQIDLFSFDWKLPKDVAIKAVEYIKFVPKEYLHFLTTMPEYRYRAPLYINLIVLSLYLLTSISMPVICYLIIKNRKQLPASYLLLSIIFILTILIWVFNGPDIRFTAAINCIFIAFILILFFEYGKNKIKVKKTILFLFSVFLIYVGVWTIRRCYYNIQTVNNRKIETGYRPYYTVIYKPYTKEDASKIIYPEYNNLFVPYEIGNGIIVFVSYVEITMEKLPSTVHQHRGKFTNYKCLEPRGNSLQDGFRLKKDCE